MKAESLTEYLQTIESIRHQYPYVQVYAGLEVDYIPHTIAPAQFETQLDYTIGSIHFVESFANGDGWEIDGSHSLFRQGLADIFGGNIRDAVTRYYELTREMVATSPPTVVGHLDKIKIQNKEETLFREEDVWYRDEVKKTLRAIRDQSCILEVNTRGIYQKKSATPYPGPWALEEAFQLKIPITLSSDAHHRDDLINCFPETARTLRQIGFKKMRILLDGIWQDVDFDEHGLHPTRITYHPMA